MPARAAPSQVAIVVPSSLKRARLATTRSCARISSSGWPSRSAFTSAYFTSGCTLSAWFDGMVHGVVVQMTMKPFSVGSDGRPKAAASFSGSANLKPTSMAGSRFSAYSTSASASADWQSKHQLTGFRPR